MAIKRNTAKEFYDTFRIPQKAEIPLKLQDIMLQNQRKRKSLDEKQATSINKVWRESFLSKQTVESIKETSEDQQPEDKQTSKIEAPIIPKDNNLKPITFIRNEKSKISTIVGRDLGVWKKHIIDSERKRTYKKQLQTSSNFMIKRLSYLKVLAEEIKKKKPVVKPKIVIDLSKNDIVVENNKMKVKYTVIGSQSDPQIWKNIVILNYTDQNWTKCLKDIRPQLPPQVVAKLEDKQTKTSEPVPIKDKVIPVLIGIPGQTDKQIKTDGQSQLLKPPQLSSNIFLNAPPETGNRLNPFINTKVNNKISLDSIINGGFNSTDRQISTVRPIINIPTYNIPQSQQVPFSDKINNPFNRNVINNQPIVQNFFPQLNQPNLPISSNTGLFPSNYQIDANAVLGSLINKTNNSSLQQVGLFGPAPVVEEKKNKFVTGNRAKKQEARAFG